MGTHTHCHKKNEHTEWGGNTCHKTNENTEWGNTHEQSNTPHMSGMHACTI